MKLLIVEDNAVICAQLEREFKRHKYIVEVSADGDDAYYKMTNWEYDGVLLDVMLPKMSGLEVLKRVRSEGVETPVLLLTARSELDHRIEGLDLGADDYLPKPFEMAELHARVRALTRRGKTVMTSRIVVGRVELDMALSEVWLDGEKVDLTATEYTILECLMLSKGSLVSTAKLIEATHNENNETFSNSLNVHMHNLRKKLGSDMITTVRGRGYTIKD